MQKNRPCTWVLQPLHPIGRLGENVCEPKGLIQTKKLLASYIRVLEKQHPNPKLIHKSSTAPAKNW